MKKTLLTLSCIALSMQLWAQTPVKKDSTTSPASINTEATAKKGTKPGFGMGLNLSTNGIGIDVAHTLGKSGKLIARLDGRIFNTEIKNLEVAVDKDKLVANAKAQVGAIGLMLDYHPFGNAFKLVGGFTIPLNDISASAMMKDSVAQGDIMIAPDEIGTINFGLKLKPSPYLGIGFGRAVPSKRFGFTFEVGAYYTGAPDISFSATGMLEPTSSQEAVLQNNLSGLTWWPMMNFGFNFRLGKIN